MPPNEPIPLSLKLRLPTATFEAALFGVPEVRKMPMQGALLRQFWSAVHNAG